MGNTDLFDLGADLDKTKNDNLLQQYQKSAAQLFTLKQELQKVESVPGLSFKKIEDAITEQMHILESKIQDRLDNIL